MFIDMILKWIDEHILLISPLPFGKYPLIESTGVKVFSTSQFEF